MQRNDTHNFPLELMRREQWVAATITPDPARPGKTDKRPVNPVTGGPASTTDPQTWGTYAQACSRADGLSATGLSAIGFVFTAGDPYTGIDFDQCYGADGRVDAEVARMVRDLDSYTERSISGKGLHVIVRGNLPPGGRRKGNVEMYDRSRFFVLTGDALPGKLWVCDRQAELSALHAAVFGQTWVALSPAGEGRAEAAGALAVVGMLEATTESAEEQTGRGLSDDELLAHAFKAANGAGFGLLWRGETSRYASQSEADLALACHLAFWTGGDAVRMDRLFRRSGLHRAKWDQKHYGSGATYGQATIAKALQTSGEHYQPYIAHGAEAGLCAGVAQAGLCAGVAQSSGLCADTGSQAGGLRHDTSRIVCGHGLASRRLAPRWIVCGRGLASRRLAPHGRLPAAARGGAARSSAGCGRVALVGCLRRALPRLGAARL
jgi:putative DNA primase/helicase